MADSNFATGPFNDHRSADKREEIYQMIVEQARDGIVIAQDNVLKFANDSAASLFGWEKDELIGMEFIKLVPSESQDRVLEIYQNRLAGKSVPEINQIVLMRKGGERFIVESNARLIEFDGKPASLVFIRDISERKRSEHLLKETRSQLDQINKELEEKDKELEDFTCIASHDLREPLRTIKNYCSLLEEDLGNELTPDVKQDLQFITDAALRMNHLVKGLSDLSRAGRQKMEESEVPLETCLVDAKNILETLIIETNGSISWRNLPTVKGDSNQLTSVFQNLIDNALKFKSDSIPKVDIFTTEREGFWEITVRDNGIGISPEYHERIFEPFRRLKEVKRLSGSGIGLTLCRKIIEGHGGKIWVESVPGMGSSFKFKLAKL